MNSIVSIKENEFIEMCPPWSSTQVIEIKNGVHQKGAQEVIEFVTENTSPIDFDLFCQNVSGYELHYGWRSPGATVFLKAVTKKNIPLLLHIAKKLGKIGLNIQNGQLRPIDNIIYYELSEKFWIARELIKMGSYVNTRTISNAIEENNEELVKLFVYNGALKNEKWYEKVYDWVKKENIFRTGFVLKIQKLTSDEQAFVDTVMKEELKKKVTFILSAKEIGLSTDLCQEILSYNNIYKI